MTETEQWLRAHSFAWGVEHERGNEYIHAAADFADWFEKVSDSYPSLATAFDVWEATQ